MQILFSKNKKTTHLPIFNRLFFYFIFFFLIPFYHEQQQSSNSFIYFQRKELPGGNILLPNENEIDVIGSDFNFLYKNDYTEFNNNEYYSKISITQLSHLEYFSIGQFQYSDDSGQPGNPNKPSHYFLLKVMDQYYFFDETGQNIKTNFTINMSKKNNYIIPYVIYLDGSYKSLFFEFFTGEIKENNVTIYQYKCKVDYGNAYILNKYSFELLDSNNKLYYFQTDYIPCEYTTVGDRNYELVCFFSGNNELTTIILLPSSHLKELSKITIKDINAKYIKIAISEKREKILVCYMENYSGAVYCLIYDAFTRTFSEKRKYFSRSEVSFYQFDVFYEVGRREYVIQSHKSNYELQIVILNENFENSIYNEKGECIILYTIPNCYYVFVSHLIIKEAPYNPKDGKYFVIYTCQSDNGNVFKQNELPLTCNEIINREEILNTTDTTINDKNSSSIIENNVTKENKIEYLNDGQGTYKAETNKSSKEIIENLESVVEDIEIGKSYEIKGEDFEIKIHPINSNIDQNSTNVNFLECENILREKYGLSEKSILTTLQIEIDSNNDKSLTNQVEYAIFDENKNKLDLSYCSDVKIKISYEIKDPSILNSSLIDSFSDLGIDVLNINDSFFNDICYPYSENDSKTDVILRDRINDIYQNFSLCDSNCQYEEINTETNLIECSCNIKTNITSEKNNNTNFGEMVFTTFKNTNFAVIKCYNLVFSIKGISNNFGFYIFLILIIGHIPLIIYYFLYGIDSVKLFIFKEMQNKNFLVNLGNPVTKKNVEFQDEENRPDSNNNCSSKYFRKYTKAVASQSRNDINYKRFPSNKIQINITNSNLLLLNSKNGKINENYDKEPFSKKTNINFDNPEDKLPIKLNNDNKKYKNKGKNVNFEEPNYPGYYNLIRINGFKKKFTRLPESKHILTNYDYKEAIKYDTRGFWRILLICLYYKQAILNTFFFKSYLEIKVLRIIHFIFGYSLDFALNAFFYSNTKVSDRYNYEGNNLYLYSLINNITISICSASISFVLRVLFKKLINSNKKIEAVFREEEKKLKKNKHKKKLYTVSETTKENIFIRINEIIKILKIKILIFIIFEFALMLFFAYFISAFCAVYKSTQTSWFSDSIVSFIMSNLIDIFIAFIISTLYNLSITSKIEILYNISMYIYDLGH